jgi:D-3-phosphoglycerate dehydrogenase
MHQGVWEKSANNCHEIRGKTLGIIGYGHIGTQLSILAENLGIKVIYYDITDKQAFGNAQKCDCLDDLLQSADIISVHVDGRPANKHLIAEKEFSRMKKGALFLNLSRGFVVDINALAKYLKNNHLGGAAIDVFPDEPKNTVEKFFCPLQNLPNVILTPHIAGSTQESQEKIGQYVSNKIINYININT